jgi:hypothetical protein
MKVLVAGWFSFEQMGATAGDIIAKDIVCEWLNSAAVRHDVAFAHPFTGGVNWKHVQPLDYAAVLFVCGPFGNGWPVTEFLSYFAGRKLVGVNLSMLQSLDEWNPFDVIFERDSSDVCRPDITFLAPPPQVPVAGVILVHKQKEYGKRALHDSVDSAIDSFVGARELAVVHIDTALENNSGGLRSPGEVESLIAKMDVVLTTRLHGTVLSLKNGVPVIPVDPIHGGAKISQQVRMLNWPILLPGESISEDKLSFAFEFCISPAGKQEAKACALRAKRVLDGLKEQFLGSVLSFNGCN